LLEDTKAVIRSRNTKKNRQYNDQNIDDKKTSNNPQNTTQEHKIEQQSKSWENSGSSEFNYYSTSGIVGELGFF